MVYCNSGNNFLIIDSNSDYYRCYSSFGSKKSVLGNILKDQQLKKLKKNELICDYNIECNFGCREGCDYSETLRFNENDNLLNHEGINYRLTNVNHIDQLMNEIDVYWHLTNFCNFNCIYCNYPNIKKTNNLETTEKDLISIFNILNNNNDKIYYNLTGGEPSIHPGFVSLCENIFKNKEKSYLRILTNLSKTDKIKKILEWDWCSNLEFKVSCHFSDNDFDLNEFTDTCLLILNKKHYLSICIVDHPYETKYYKEYFDYFYSLGIKNLISQYYEQSRKRSDVVRKDFIPKSYGLLTRKKTGFIKI